MFRIKAHNKGILKVEWTNEKRINQNGVVAIKDKG